MENRRDEAGRKRINGNFKTQADETISKMTDEEKSAVVSKFLTDLYSKVVKPKICLLYTSPSPRDRS